MEEHKKKKKKELKTIPEDVWFYQIFRFLSQKETFSLSRISKSFLKLVQECKFSFTLETYSTIKDLNYNSLIKFNLKELTVEENYSTKPFDLSKFVSLESLKVERYNNVENDVILEQISKLKNLKKLELSFFELNYDFLTPLTNLKSFTLKNSRDLYSGNLFCIKPFESIIELNYYETKFIEKALKAFPNLKTLRIGKLGPRGLKQLSTMKKLLHLEMGEPFYNLELPNLITLSCKSYSYNTSEDLQELTCSSFENITNLKKLKKIKISYLSSQLKVSHKDLIIIVSRNCSLNLKDITLKYLKLNNFICSIKNSTIEYLEFEEFHTETRISGDYQTIKMKVSSLVNVEKMKLISGFPNVQSLIIETTEYQKYQFEALLGKNLKVVKFIINSTLQFQEFYVEDNMIDRGDEIF